MSLTLVGINVLDTKSGGQERQKDSRTPRRFAILVPLPFRQVLDCGYPSAAFVSGREPLARHIEDKLWELRDTSRTNIYRVLYFFFTGRRIVLLHGFQKKTQRTPRTDIETAQRLLERFSQLEGR